MNTPLTSFASVCEGVALASSNLSPYAGWALHQPPLILYLFSPFCSASPVIRSLVLVLFNVGSALLLWQIGQKLFPSNTSKYAYGIASIVYLLNPLTMGISAFGSMAAVHNLLVILSLFLAVKGQIIASLFFCAFAAYCSLYPILLVVPILLFTQGVIKRIVYVGVFAIWLACLFAVSVYISGSYEFFEKVYWFILTVPDLTPNIGLWWYYFTEMFAQFNPFFLFAFQFQFVFHCAGIAYIYRTQPVFVFTAFTLLISLLKSYPSYGDAALAIALLFLNPDTLAKMRYTFILGNLFVYPVILAPILWHLWVDLGSGNANFYWATCLVWAMAQVWTLIDFLSAGRPSVRRVALAADKQKQS